MGSSGGVQQKGGECEMHWVEGGTRLAATEEIVGGVATMKHCWEGMKSQYGNVAELA